MTTSTQPLLPGVDRHGSGFRVRLRFKGELYAETGFVTPDEANARVLELRRLRAAGLSPATAPRDDTLGDAAASLLARKRISGRRRPLREQGLAYWERSLRPWREGEFASLPLSLLRRDALEDAILARAAEHPTSARNELQALKAALEYAGDRGAVFDQRILRIEPVRVSKRRRKALTAPQLQLLANVAPAYAQRLILWLGTAGPRIGEAFTLEEDRVDLFGATVVIPAELCKEGVTKVIPQTAEEVRLLREQLVARAGGTKLVFPTKTGKQWRHSSFDKLVWSKSTARAAVAWRHFAKLADDAPTPFCDLTPHDLRSTAVTLMRDQGFGRDQAAARVGHADAGDLVDGVYDQGDRLQRARLAIAEHAPEGLLAPKKEPGRPTTRSDRPDAQAGSEAR